MNHTEYSRKFRKMNPSYMKKYMRKWRKTKKGRKYYKESTKSIDYKKQHLKWQNNRYKTNKKFQISRCFSSNMYQSLKGKKNNIGWQKLVNYTIKELINHLEKKFSNKMNWGNYGIYWEIDHIRPISLFNYKTAKDLEFKKCWSLKNLQPLKAIENTRKSNKLL